MLQYIHALKKSYKSILIGIIGGYIGSLVNLPLPWLLGALLLNLFVSLTKFNITFEKKIFLPVLLIIGVILAGSFNITLLYKIHLWVYSSIAMIICTIIGSIIVAFYFHKVCKFKKLVSILAGMPGAFVVIAAAINEITESKKESGQVVIPQATRVLFIVLILPFIFVTQAGYQDISSHGNNPIYDIRYFIEIIFLLFISQIGSIGLNKLNIPSAPILAAMILCGFFYTLEITTARFPDIFINIAFVFLGSAIGCRLNSLPIREIGYYSFHGFIVSVLLIVLAGIFAYMLNIFFGFDFMAAFLSFAPGSLHEMVVISIAYNIDPLFVTYHHFLRIFLIIFSIPFILRYFSKN